MSMSLQVQVMFPLPQEIQPYAARKLLISAPVVLSFFMEEASLFCRVCGWGGGLLYIYSSVCITCSMAMMCDYDNIILEISFLMRT